MLTDADASPCIEDINKVFTNLITARLGFCSLILDSKVGFGKKKSLPEAGQPQKEISKTVARYSPVGFPTVPPVHGSKAEVCFPEEDGCPCPSSPSPRLRLCEVNIAQDFLGFLIRFLV